jgi:serine/threonine protein kinase
MSAQTTEEFLGVLERSRLLSAAELENVRAVVDGWNHPSALRVAQWLVKHGRVTVWQAERLLGGFTGFFLAKGTYKFVDAIAEGAMGMVFKAEHTVMGRTVAVKVLSKARLSHPNAVARFHREVQAMAALDHPNIAHAYDAGHVGDTYYLVMEYIDGSDLNAWLEKYGRLPIPWACEFIRQAALGLDHAHQQGMVHRDVKPANLMVAWNDDEHRPVVKVLDLGLARAVGDERDAMDLDPNDPSFSHDTESQLTQAGTILGTPDYLAPEQIIQRDEVDARADIFSLGCTLFKLLTGQLPYGGPDLIGKLQARVLPSAPPAVKLRTLLPEADPELEAILAKMLERDPDNRYQTAAEVALALAPFADAPREKWATLCPSKAPAPDSSEVGSSQMQADAHLDEFFGGLKGDEPDTRSAGDELPAVHSDTRWISGDPTHASASQSGSGHVLDEEPSLSGSSLLLAKYQRRRIWRRRLWLSLLVLLIAATAVMLVVFWRATIPQRPRSTWPGDVPGLVLAWSAEARDRVSLGNPAVASLEREARQRLDATGCLSFDVLGPAGNAARGAVLTRGANLALVDACRATHELTLEIVLFPEEATDDELHVVLASQGANQPNFVLAQRRGDLGLMLRTSEIEFPQLAVKSAASLLQPWQHLVITLGQGKVCCYLNGELCAANPLPGNLEPWNAKDPDELRLGDGGRVGKPWRGKIERLALYARALSADQAQQQYEIVRREAAWLFPPK